MSTVSIAIVKLKRFWSMPVLNKLHSLSTQYYKAKAVMLYRMLFKEFGAGSYIRRPLLILNPAYISVGRGVGIRDGARLEIISNRNRLPEMHIGDGTSMEQNVHIVCRNRIQIGKNVTISANCCILDVTHPYEDITHPSKIGDRILDDDASVEIGDGCLIGFGCVILPNVKIGDYVIIGSNSVVKSSIPSYSVAVGAPAKVVKYFDAMSGRWVKVDSDPTLKRVGITS